MNELITRKDLDDLLSIFKECERDDIMCSPYAMMKQVTTKYASYKANEFKDIFLNQVKHGFYSVKETNEAKKMLFVQHMNDLKYWKNKSVVKINFKDFNSNKNFNNKWRMTDTFIDAPSFDKDSNITGEQLLNLFIKYLDENYTIKAKKQ